MLDLEMPQRLSLCSHLLKLHFPATEILPPGKLPYLEIPSDVGHREEPKLGSYHLASTNLEYFTRFGNEPTDSVPDAQANATDVSVSVSRLAECAGVSNLFAVQFFGEDDIITRCVLKTIWITTQGTVREEERIFELSSTEWQLRLAYARGDLCGSWLLLMNELITGATDRAVLHRLLKLEAYDQAFSDEQVKWWPVAWDELSFQSANQLLANHLEHMYVEDGIGAAYAPMVILHAYGEDETIDARLPCDHSTTFNVGFLKGLSQEQCVKACCEVVGCRKRIMTDADDRQLKLEEERQVRARWAFEQIDWERLDEEPKDDERTAEVSGTSLLQSLNRALSSMRVPSSVASAAFDLANFVETIVIMKHFQRNLGPAIITMSPRAIFNELEKHAVDAIQAACPFEDMNMLGLVLTPGYENLLLQWMRRTVNYAVGPSLLPGRAREIPDPNKVIQELKRVELDNRPDE